MWPLEGRGPREWVRVGALAVERWVTTGNGLSLAGSHALPEDGRGDPACLSAAIAALYPAPVAVKAGLVLESAWLPLLLADTGGALWSRTHVELLLRHQMDTVYGDGTQAAAAGWTLRTDHRIGARHALGYGLAPAVKLALVDAGMVAGVVWRELVPSFAWGWQRLHAARRSSARNAWWLWPEQDRCVLARVQGGEVASLNTALGLCGDAAAVERAVAAEAVRQGMGVDQRPVNAASWLATPQLAPSRDRLTWVSIVGSDEGVTAPGNYGTRVAS